MNINPEFIKGVITRLKATAPLTAIVGTRIYSDVPQQTTFPYCLVSTRASDWSAKDYSGMQLKLSIQVFSKEPDLQQCSNAQSAILDALDRHEENVTVTGYTLCYLQKATLLDIIKEPNGFIWQSITEFDALIQ